MEQKRVEKTRALRGDASALTAATPERHFHLVHNETMALRPGNYDFGVNDVDVKNCSTTRAHQVVVIANIGIKPRGAGTEIERLNFAQFTKIIEYLVNGLERNRRHGGCCSGVDRFSSRVRLIVMQDSKHQVALRCGLETFRPKKVYEFGGRLHGSTLHNIDC